MGFLDKTDTFGHLGVKTSYHPWEVSLTRKLNFLSLVGVFNVIITLLLFLSIGIHDFVTECLITLCVGPMVVVLNIKRNYIWAAYLFYGIGISLFFLLTLKMGIDSYVILYYFPILVSLIQVFGRKETLKHLFIIAFLFFMSIVGIVIAYKNDFNSIQYTIDSLLKLKLVNILSAFFLTVVLICIITIENLKQETLIKNTLREKEILLAEVFHRVKNNMNIVTSLLNLKKFSTKSEEVKQALEECRERVFSMALVHQIIYSNKNITSLNFKEYIEKLVGESVNSIGGIEKADVEFDTESIELPLFYAIPCGLILNELITNSFKHAQIPGKKLRIEITFKNVNDNLLIRFSDNGPGFTSQTFQSDSLGLDLIKSLAEQIDAVYNIQSFAGCVFEMQFTNKKL
ncbi:MAG: sensor histidine kinase [Bacteroidota bacterium]